MDPNPEVSFRVLERSEYAAASEVLARSFAEETMFRHFLGADLEEHWSSLVPFMRAMVEAHAPPTGRVDGALVDRRVVGVSVSVNPSHFPLEGLGVLRIALRTLPAILRLGLSRPRIFRLLRVGASMEKFHPRDEPTRYMAFFGVHPDYRVNAVAHQLVARVLQDADETGVGCYLDTAGKTTKRMCHLLGFRVHHELQIDGPDGPTFYGMWRRPRGVEQ